MNIEVMDAWWFGVLACVFAISSCVAVGVGSAMLLQQIKRAAIWFFVGPPNDKRLDDVSLFEPDRTVIEIPKPCNIEQTLAIMKVEARARIAQRRKAEMFRQANRIPVPESRTSCGLPASMPSKRWC